MSNYTKLINNLEELKLKKIKENLDIYMVVLEPLVSRFIRLSKISTLVFNQH